MSQPSPLLQIRDLSYQYDQHFAVENLDLTISKGSVFGFLGPNGAGKTTTIACIAGLLKDWRGSMMFDEQPFAPAVSISDRRRIGLVPQELAIYGELTARENLRFFAKLHGLRGERLNRRIDQSLALAGLTERADDLAGQFSGGMKRRLNLAIGQIHQPDLLLLDEPTAGVDPQSRNHLLDSLESLAKGGTTILYTSHYIEEIERLCDEIAIMNDGRIIASGTAAQLAAQTPGESQNLENVFLHLTGRSLRDD